ncbi:hypothetical protein BCR41DRAFT_353150 [Lobosporangium transversale]|uniref:Uncharacterized protein n=1 Tax=Lobosporangium transversale TaxID=64571 RepID=A0A1Y2GNM0_9FUNG|nr:hypothetical protein BCR41DRAFT_353150 [Lobosporangium transversale]ORZ16771.1 hypothetical protein BCR41DRAFT_353150 [Lobosporangium transversale]|eukprot:XP_021881706.1 hypothetical protein BCR41DRAFT_353150 [Lobosporangium transversale]
MPSSNNNNGSNTTTGGSANSKHPFMVGSLLQQRVEAEKQEIENMKQQLKMREQAGVIGALRGAVGSSGITNESTTSLNYSPGYVQQQQLQQQQNQHQQQLLQQHQLQMQQLQQQQSGPRFGGPGTLIEKGEARTAQLLERSKSAGTGLMRPSAHSSKSGYQKTRSKSRGAPEDRVPLGGNASPHSQSPKLPSYSNGGAQPVPQGPLLQFEDPNAMIQPGLLLSRAKSAKPALNSGNKNSGTGSQNSNGSSKSRQVTGGEALSSHGNRPRIKPLIDLRNHNTGQDVIKPGLLTNSSSNSSSNNTQVSSYSQSAKSPQRRNKPLLEF